MRFTCVPSILRNFSVIFHCCFQMKSLFVNKIRLIVRKMHIGIMLHQRHAAVLRSLRQAVV